MTREKCDFLAILRTVRILTWRVIRAILRSDLEPVAKTSHEEKSVLCKVLGNLSTIFMTLVQGFLYVI